MALHDLIAWFVTGAVAYLLASYALGGPLALGRTVVAVASRRRARYRGHPDEVLASSRFTIPVSIILPIASEQDATGAIEHLLGLTYPEHEVIVVTGGPRGVPAAIREHFDLKACEIFFRRSLATPPVRGLYRSGSDPRLLVIECDAAAGGSALNCGVNLARYRYVCCADHRARYAPDSLLMGMQPAVEDPGVVIAVTTTIAAPNTEDGSNHLARGSVRGLLQRLSALRELLGRGGHNRLRLAPDGLAGFALWRRDVVLEAGGFAPDLTAAQADLTLRAHRQLLRSKQPYRIVHIGEPVGTASDGKALDALLAEQLRRRDAMASAVWRSRGMLLNPSYGRLGLVDLPQLLLTSTVVPWFELLCLVALPFAPVFGVLTVPHLLAAIVAIALGNGLLINTAMLRTPLELDEQRTLRLALLAPLEVFVARPAKLWSRVTGLTRTLTRPVPTGA
jgi:poly-beta-1,6-N-acetyl-D-glucosamine synthase